MATNLNPRPGSASGLDGHKTIPVSGPASAALPSGSSMSPIAGPVGRISSGALAANPEPNG